MNYLGKRKMYSLLCNILNRSDLLKSKYYDYKFYRGTEWLTGNINNGSVKLTSDFNGTFLRIRIWDYDGQLIRNDIIKEFPAVSLIK